MVNHGFMRCLFIVLLLFYLINVAIGAGMDHSSLNKCEIKSIGGLGIVKEPERVTITTDIRTAVHPDVPLSFLNYLNPFNWIKKTKKYDISDLMLTNVIVVDKKKEKKLDRVLIRNVSFWGEDINQVYAYQKIKNELMDKKVSPQYVIIGLLYYKNKKESLGKFTNTKNDNNVLIYQGKIEIKDYLAEVSKKGKKKIISGYNPIEATFGEIISDKELQKEASK